MSSLPESTPRQTCQVCGAVEQVKPDSRGFPPDIAKRRLERRCKTAGHTAVAQYRAGFIGFSTLPYFKVEDA